MGYTLEVTGGEWNSFDIDLDAFAGVDLARVFQLKFDSQAGVVGDDTGLTNFYMDNMYFSTATPTIGTPAPATAPTTAATAPTVGNEAISLYSDTLTDDSVVTNFNPGWGQSGSLAAATDVDAAVGNVLKFTNLNYQGVELNETDVSAQESFHLDLWAAETGKVKVFLVSTDGQKIALRFLHP